LRTAASSSTSSSLGLYIGLGFVAFAVVFFLVAAVVYVMLKKRNAAAAAASGAQIGGDGISNGNGNNTMPASANQPNPHSPLYKSFTANGSTPPAQGPPVSPRSGVPSYQSFGVGVRCLLPHCCVDFVCADDGIARLLARQRTVNVSADERRRRRRRRCERHGDDGPRGADGAHRAQERWRH
jgi:hypothetical protein